MKNVNLLKVLATLTLVLLISGAYAQKKDVNLTKKNDISHTVTVGKPIPFYVEPDAYYNPNYTEANSWGVTSTFLWSFDDAELTGAVDPSAADKKPTFTSNTVINPDITFNEKGEYTLAVRESSASCDGNIQLQVIKVIDAPSCNFGDRPDIDNNCGDLAATDVKFDIAINGATNYKVDWTIDVDNLTADKASVIDALNGSTGTFADLDEETVDADFATSGAGLVLTNQAFPVVNGKVTRYTFTLTGINDEISRRSDYIAGGRVWDVPATAWVNHPAAADDKFVIIVLPAPTTGPIYHLDI
ncbi:MAG: hypothetical protein MI739_07130 [Bacteroidales bacterium]|nr:hypothetical protein [Bacteroidales bacterium]